MYVLQKIEMEVEKIAFPCFYIFAFCILTDTPTDKIFLEEMLKYEHNVHSKNRHLSQSEAEKIMFLYFYIFAFCSLTDRPRDKIFIE